MQPTSRVVGTFEVTPASGSNEPPDVFCGLASLIVEGRIPRHDARGYSEGPHVPPKSSKSLSHRHECSDENNMCKKDENFRKHMLLLWQNNVPVSIEVLLCSTCRVSQQKVRSVEFSTTPEPGSILLEQWTVSIQNHRSGQHLITSNGLLQAVRSYLHFSQLSAWYSSSKGQEPKNVLYRITIPGEAFASKFSCRPEEHSFPSANVGRTSSVHVSVRSLPRCDEIPGVTCAHNSTLTGLTLSPIPGSGSSCASSEPGSPDQAVQDQYLSSPEEAKLPIAASLEWKSNDPHESETDLRRTLVKTRLAECQGKLSRSDSMDSMLGDSLLDPPQCLQKIPPKRYQSPSRCGSPSLEAPDHLLFGSNKSNDPSVSHNDSNQSRLARQDLLRRRDINLYTGLHPRLLHGQQNQNNSPRLSLFSHQIEPQPRNMPCRAFPPQNQPQMPSPSSFNQPQFNSTPKGDQNLGAKQKQKTIKQQICDYESEEEAEDGVLPEDLMLNLNLKSNCSSRRSSLLDEDCLFPQKCKNKKQNSTTLEDILGIQPESGIFSHDESPVTRVYRAEIPHLPLQQPQISEVSQSDPFKEPEELSKSEILLGAILRTCERNRHLEENKLELAQVTSPSRLRSFSENGYQYRMEPLDLSFDATSSKDWSEDEEDINEVHEVTEVDQTSRRSSFSSDCHVPTPDECATFRQSFDNATSMVFHHKTGLPLTSSPAPLRRGRDKFDFDASITSPHDIKKALFAKKSNLLLQKDDENKENVELKSPQVPCTPVTPILTSAVIQTRNKRERRPSKKLLSASAPATLTSNNLLGSFEESVLNGRLEPNSTVEGFTAEIGASGSFQPKHKTLPVTVFFYTLCDNAAYSSPYLGHINLGKKGYRVPPKGTIQVTLFNPLGTVVKMFVVMYDLSDMPPNSQTFLRQRTLYMPSEGVNDAELQKWLRYLVHLRFASSKSGKIYLHTDIRMIIFRKSDLDTAADFTSSKGFELRSFTQGPNNPKFSPRR